MRNLAHELRTFKVEIPVCFSQYDIKTFGLEWEYGTQRRYLREYNIMKELEVP